MENQCIGFKAQAAKTIMVIYENMNFSLIHNEKKKNDLLEKINDFDNKKEFRELIIKEKLFFKDKSEKVIFYNLDD